MFEKLTKKKKLLDKYRPLLPEVTQNLEEWFRVELTYTSNAIEGNTLSRRETALVIEEGLTVEGKTLKEHLEAVNHKEALEFTKDLVKKKKKDLTEKDILSIHKLILSKIDDKNAGLYRVVPVMIAGTNVILPNPQEVPRLMKNFFTWLTVIQDEHPAKIAADAHFKFVSIHPFIDGNGRVARLLMNLLLTQEGYPPAFIKKEERRRYLNSLEQAQLGGRLDDFYNLISEAVERSLDIYLEMASGGKLKAKYRHDLEHD